MKERKIEMDYINKDRAYSNIGLGIEEYKPLYREIKDKFAELMNQQIEDGIATKATLEITFE